MSAEHILVARKGAASVLAQWDWPEDEAIRREIAGSSAAFAQGFQSGARRFVAGTGRHGEGVAS